MADDLTPAALAARVQMSSWTINSSAAEGDSWFAVLPFDENRKALVIASSGRWAWTSTGSDGQVRLHELQPPDVVGVLPLLELDPAGLRDKLATSATLLQTSPEDLVAALPVADLFGAAFEAKSDYWIELALRWMETPFWSSVPAAAMEAVVDDPRVSQNHRHRTQKLLSRRASG